MADITITAANVQQSSSAKVLHGIAAAAITAGQLLYKDANGQMALSDADDAATAKCDGIALNDAAAGQPVSYATEDDNLAIGGTAAAGTIYVVSTTPGGVAPEADLASGDFPCVVAVGISATAVRFRATSAFQPGVAHA